jgi:hypothetical protein
MNQDGMARQGESLARRSQRFNGAPRAYEAHLPGRPGGPQIYALCPGCAVHPDGGTFPMAELARAEGCPAARRLALGSESSSMARRLAGTSISGERECRGAGREGPAHPGTERREAPLPSPSPFLFFLTAPWRLGEGLVKDLRRRLSRARYFRRRQSLCRRRLSRIVSDPSWIS